MGHDLLAGLNRRNVEGCEDLLGTYFIQASKRPHDCRFYGS